MVARYGGKFRRSSYPQATRKKTFNFLRYLSLKGGRFGIPPQEIFFSLLGGRLFLPGETYTPIPPSTSYNGRRS